MSWPREVSLSRLAAEGHAHEPEQRPPLFVGLCRGRDGNRHAAGLLALVGVNLGKNNLSTQAERIIAPAVERLIRNALEVAHPRQCHMDQPIEKLEHVLAPQR